jgi:hypothetical protein
VLQAREHASTPYPFVIFTFGLTVESIKEFGGASMAIIVFLQKTQNKHEQKKMKKEKG